MPQRNQFSGKVEFDVHKTKKSTNQLRNLERTTMFGLGIIKLGQLTSK